MKCKNVKKHDNAVRKNVKGNKQKSTDTESVDESQGDLTTNFPNLGDTIENTDHEKPATTHSGTTEHSEDTFSHNSSQAGGAGVESHVSENSRPSCLLPPLMSAWQIPTQQHKHKQ